MLKGVIFDMDGVLINSEPLHYKAYNMITEEMGFSFPYEEYKQFIGSTNEKKRMLIETQGYEKIPGIPELVKNLYDQGLKLAVTSSSPLKNIINNTKFLGIHQYFEKLITGEDVEHPKPAPDVFLKAVNELGLHPEECMVIEDSENGVKAAKQARITCIGYSNPDSGDQDLADAFYLVEGFEEVDFDFIHKVYQRSKGLSWQIAETDRLILREMTLWDMDDIYKLYEDPSVTAYMEDLYEDKDRELAFMKDYIHNMYGFYEYGLWLAIEKKSRKIIGRVGLANRNVNGELEIELGYMIGVAYQRKGYATEACKEVLNYVKEKLEFEKVNCFIRKGNLPSIRFVEKLGFQLVEEMYLSNETLIKYTLQLVE